MFSLIGTSDTFVTMLEDGSVVTRYDAIEPTDACPPLPELSLGADGRLYYDPEHRRVFDTDELVRLGYARRVRVTETKAYITRLEGGGEPSPREQFELVFGRISDGQWQWLKEFVARQVGDG